MTRDEWDRMVVRANVLLPDRPREPEWADAWFDELKGFPAERVEAAMKLAIAETRNGALHGPDILRGLGMGRDPQGDRNDDLAAFDAVWDGLWRLRESFGWSRVPALTDVQSWLVRLLGGWEQMGMIELRDLPTHRAQARDAFVGRRSYRRRRGLEVTDGPALTPAQRLALDPPAELPALMAPVEAEQDGPVEDYGERLRELVVHVASQVEVDTGRPDDDPAELERRAEASRRWKERHESEAAPDEQKPPVQ